MIAIYPNFNEKETFLGANKNNEKISQKMNMKAWMKGKRVRRAVKLYVLIFNFVMGQFKHDVFILIHVNCY